jgi:hypothetical protein
VDLELPYNPPSSIPERRDGILRDPFFQKNGEVEVPRRPGLGLEIDWRALGRWGTRFFLMDNKRLVWFALRDRGLKAALEIDRNRRAARGES